MALRIATAALLSASAAAEVSAAEKTNIRAGLAVEMQCMGRLAHEVSSSPETGDYFVRPVPERDQECLVAWPNLGGDHVFCTGVNQDESCDGAAKPSFDLRYDSQCKDCFVGAKTDIWYDFNVTGFHLNKVGFGFRDTTVINQVELVHDGVSKAHEWNKIFFPTEKVFAHRFLPTISLKMPTVISYKISDDFQKVDVGASVEINIPSMSVQYVSGEGLSHTFDKPQLSLKPLMADGLGNAGNIDLGINSSMEVTFDDGFFNASYKSSFSTLIPIVNTATVDLQGVKDCGRFGLDFDLTQEADFAAHIWRLNKEFKFGPWTFNRERPDMVQKCFERTRPVPAQQQPAIVV